MKKVLILNGNSQYRDMFLSNGWGIAPTMKEADLVQFCGGEDVTPALYGEDPDHRSHFNTRRDLQEMFAYHEALARKLPMSGICRGGQFLHVMNGGKMRQHVEGHALYDTHPCYVTLTDSLVDVTSTHHQQMIYDWTLEVELLGYGSTERLHGDLLPSCETEILSYNRSQCLCFQPHPEFYKGSTQNLYFSLLSSELGL